MAVSEDRSEGGNGAGVLLYYKYAPVPDIDFLVRFYDSNCRSLALLGRVRIAPSGVNVTVGGNMPSLEKHIAALKSMSLFDDTDFKLASCEHPSDSRITRECGFTELSIRVVKELVTFRSDPLAEVPKVCDAGRHLSAAEFHSVLHDAVIPGTNMDSKADKQLVLLDARNLYETRIGKFKATNVETLDPELRQYSDLASWIDQHSEKLHGKHILMYCTGGIRCETASAYIRSKGVGFENVFQLFGGIQRYLEQFPTGGYFRGKNFVFDHRISVGSKETDVIGSCLLCGISFDDYSSRCRCHYCRMLVLVCYDCQVISSRVYVCELCQKNGKGSNPMMLQEDEHEDISPDSLEEMGFSNSSFPDITPAQFPRTHGNSGDRKLRILCLHGFRQNASNFKGRTSSLAKKLKNMVEFVFVDAPHELPFIYKPRSSDSSYVQQSPPPEMNRRYAWLTSEHLNLSDEQCWRMIDAPFDPLQYQQQTFGFEVSYQHLKNIISHMGPFDGVLGFSQGAAMAALFCQQQQRSSHVMDFQFAILCSGFLPIPWGSKESIRCPSLHCFGSSQGQDRQIANQASRELAGMFDEECSMIIEHEMGHIIPTRSPYIDQMKNFLRRFL
ncbi:rhodanese-like domain-containing protein 6 isoform X1 [Zingiber officinale]|uniref:rhodanese-like domain-containing protein 6 isoform X1 n=1 Tax=Zingiber officinale TaxID=94328 RepID=UPI001C4AB82E|nr:rhodanese-like domain-containing protein 6 isoform X1 [Zingiber officinale]